jgi:hypothetical protein
MTKGKEKKLRRVAEVRAHKEVMSKRRDAASRRDLLQNYAAFKRFSRQGVEAMLEGVHGVDLSDEDVDACIALQCANLSGAAEGSWDEASARQALRHDESRVLLMHGPLPVAMPATTEAAEVEEVDVGDEWDFVPEWQPNPKHEPEPEVPADDKTSAPEATDGELTQRAEGEVLLGFVHLQFCLSEGTPLLCVLNVRAASPERAPLHTHPFPTRHLLEYGSTRHRHIRSHVCYISVTIRYTSRLHACAPHSLGAADRRLRRVARPPFAHVRAPSSLDLCVCRRCKCCLRRWAVGWASLLCSSSN